MSWAPLPTALAVAPWPLLDFEVLIDASDCEDLASKIWFSFRHYSPGFREDAKTSTYQIKDIFGMVSWPVGKVLGDHQLGDWKVTLNHLEPIYYHENQVVISDSYVSWRFQQLLPACFLNGPEIVLESVLKIHPHHSVTQRNKSILPDSQFNMKPSTRHNHQETDNLEKFSTTTPILFHSIVCPDVIFHPLCVSTALL